MEPTGIGGAADEFERSLTEARQALRSVRTANANAGAGAEPVQGLGEAKDGLIKVVFEQGRLAKVEVDAKARRLDSDELAAAFKEAANAALADLESKAATPPPGDAGLLTDPAALDARLSELQDQSLRQMTRYTQAIAEMTARLGRG